MSVPTGVQAPHRTDSHGHCPQNRLTCANRRAEPCAPKRIQPGRTFAEADEPLTGGGYHPIPTRPRHYPADTPIPAHRKQMAHWRYQPSQHDSDLPAEPVTLIDLSCTPDVPGIHLQWTCTATGRAPATTPTHPILPN